MSVCVFVRCAWGRGLGGVGGWGGLYGVRTLQSTPRLAPVTVFASVHKRRCLLSHVPCSQSLEASHTHSTQHKQTHKGSGCSTTHPYCQLSHTPCFATTLNIQQLWVSLLEDPPYESVRLRMCQPASARACVCCIMTRMREILSEYTLGPRWLCPYQSSASRSQERLSLCQCTYCSSWVSESAPGHRHRIPSLC